MSVVGNWEREAQRFAPDLRVHVHHGRERLKGRAFARGAREGPRRHDLRSGPA
jgi:SNF2 family DNA or RNA helicase